MHEASRATFGRDAMYLGTGGSIDILRPSGGGVRLRVDWLFGRVEQEGVTQ